MDFSQHISRLPIPFDPARGQTALDALPGVVGRAADLIRGAAGCSPYLAGLIRQEADWLSTVIGERNLAPAMVAARETEGFDEFSADALGPALRRAKRRVALLTALADLGGIWSLEQVTGALTGFADRATDLALRVHVRAEIARGKLPETDSDAGGIMALAMGKMGAAELNYSSDIDLIILYDDQAFAPDDLHDARASLIRATRRAVATLSDNTADGYVFRTDLRLRPDASVTPVCISTSAALAYYEAEGRTWERSAYIKARACAGNIKAGQRFLDDLRPFVWRRHLDFATIEDAHDMRRRIRDHKGLGGQITIPGHDMKLGRGGIREIEFFTQTRQLIAGGRDPDLRLRGTVDGLAMLADKGWIPHEIASELTGHYRGHREVEHRIQMVNDAQTHAVPASEEGIRNIALMMGEADPVGWSRRLDAGLCRVERLTGDFFAPTEGGERPDLPSEARAIIERWPNYPALRSQRARQIFSRIEADFLTRVSRVSDPIGALTHFDAFLAGLPAGVQIFSLFEANPQLVDLIVDIFGTVPGLASYLARHPEVLDAVLGGGFFSEWPGPSGLRDGLQTQLDTMMSSPDGGYERALDATRRWTHEWQFRIGVHHLRGLIGADEAGVQYADIADAVLATLFPLVAQEMSTRHGPPPGRGAVLVGMGSLGAHLLNASSDLDLIVIYDNAGQDSSEGPRPLAARPYFARLAQAMITAVSAPTAAGRAYEVDMRLRPSGRQGPVATSLESFRNYQLDEAWTWEHLALTRARVVAFCGLQGAQLAEDVEALRVEVLARRGQDIRVMSDLADMRGRIFSAKGADNPWEVKAGPGRLQDIDLYAQSLALRSAAPARGTAAQLRAGERRQLIGRDESRALGAAWRFMWRVNAVFRLLSEKTLDPDLIGQGGKEFLLRETGNDSVTQLRSELGQHFDRTSAIIESAIEQDSQEKTPEG